MTIKISVIEGYLSSIEKKAVKALLNVNLMSAHVNRKDYFIVKNENIYSVTICEKDNSMVLSKDKIRCHKVQFRLK